MQELLFEIYSEEIPSEMQEYGAEKLYNTVKTKLKKLFNQEFEGEYFFTPRRIGFYIENIPKILNEKTEEVRGPKITATAQAINGFLKKYNIADISKLIKKGEYYYYINRLERKNSNELLKPLLEEAISTFQWSKSMRWADYQMRWIRPIHSILCVYNNEVIPVQYGHIKATNATTTGCWMLDDKRIKVNSFKEYKSQLEKAKVYIFQEQRLKLIREQAQKICKKLDIQMIDDQELLKEVANLIEFPYVAVGKIDERFMALPKEALVATLKFHQKYLMTEYADKKLAPYFIIVSNIMTRDNLKTVVAGNEKVLKARLADTEFFYNQDSKTKLIDKFSKLEKVTFHHDIGSYHDKIQMIKDIAINLANQLRVADEGIVKNTVMLIKADLVTEMVKELPELQGIAGYYYALKDGETDETANAIKEHYLPQGPSDPVPSSYLSIIMALSDKIVTLNAMFNIGIKPTGSKDPFALRRTAIGIIRIICTNKLKLSLYDLLKKDVMDFILDRVKFMDSDEKNLYSIDLKYIKNALYNGDIG